MDLQCPTDGVLICLRLSMRLDVVCVTQSESFKYIVHVYGIDMRRPWEFGTGRLIVVFHIRTPIRVIRALVNARNMIQNVRQLRPPINLEDGWEADNSPYPHCIRTLRRVQSASKDKKGRCRHTGRHNYPSRGS